MLPRVQNVRHIEKERPESTAMELIYFKIRAGAENDKTENAHCCYKRIKTSPGKKRNLVPFT
jgi:hypothetical protein